MAVKIINWVTTILQFHFVIKLAVENKTITCRKIGCMLSGAVVDSKDAAVDVMVSFPGAE